MNDRLPSYITVALSMCLTCAAAEPTSDQPLLIEPLSERRAAQIIGKVDTISSSIVQQMENAVDARDRAILEDVRDVMTHSSEWRWYSRDRGILLAIPVRERLGIFGTGKSEDMMADIVRRLIYQQGWGNPRVWVVFIEPKHTSSTASSCNACSATP